MNLIDYEIFQRAVSGGLSSLMMSQGRLGKTNMQMDEDFINPQQHRIAFGIISDVFMWFLEWNFQNSFSLQNFRFLTSEENPVKEKNHSVFQRLLSRNYDSLHLSSTSNT